MIKELTAIEMAIDRLDKFNKFNAGIYEKARNELEIAQLREDLDLAKALVEKLTDEVTELTDKIEATVL